MVVPEQADTGATWWARVASVVAASVLVAFSVTYYLTYEPAVSVGVRWRDGITVERRTELERRFRLVNRTPSEKQFRYDLLDTRRENIQALLTEPDTEATESLDRTSYVVPPDISYGQSWMWVAHRIPGLRAPGVVAAIVMTCVVVLAVGVRTLANGWRRRRVS